MKDILCKICCGPTKSNCRESKTNQTLQRNFFFFFFKSFFFSFIFFPRFLYIFYNTILIPAVIQGWARPCLVVSPAPGLHGGRGDWVRIEPRTGINSHRVRIEPGTGHQQSSVLTTEFTLIVAELKIVNPLQCNRRVVR